MKKKKIMILISLAIVFAYLASLFVVFGAAKRIVTDEFRGIVGNLSDAPSVDNNPDYSTQQLLDQIMYAETTLFTNYSFPYAAAIYDSEGKIVAKSGSMLRVIVSEEPNLEYYCYLDDYLTTEMKAEIFDYCKEDTAFFDSMTGKCVFDFNIENDRIVPVKLYAENYNGKKTLNLEFSEEEAQYTIDESGVLLRIYACLVDINDKSYNHDLYEQFEDVVERYELHSPWSDTTTDEQSLIFDSFTLRGETYYLYGIAGFVPFMRVIDSGVFETFFIQETVLFAVIGIALLLATGILLNKNERLEKSRLAFTSAAAHELKTPLAVISNQCECIIENVMPEKNVEYVGSIYDETRRMNKLVASLLQYNRLNSVKSISKDDTDLCEIINSELQKYDALIKDKNINVEVDAENGTQIKCNYELIGLAIDNFLSNAVKHSPENGLIKLRVKRDKKSVTVTVFNKGSEIKKEDAKHIWEEFYREDKARNSKDNSTGMGLAICRRIFELHKFKYGFKNVDGGVEFSFTAK